MVSPAGPGRADGPQGGGRFRIFNSPSTGAARALAGMLVLVLILTGIAMLARAQEKAGAEPLGSRRDAVALAAAGDTLARIHQVVSTFSDRNRQALQWVEGRLRQTA